MRGRVLGAMICAAGLTTGCAGTSSVSDALTGGALEKKKSAVAVLRAQILGHGCSGGTITVGKKLGDIYSAVATLKTTSASATAGNDVMQAELPPDEYHVINMTCGTQQGRTMTSVALGQKEGTNIIGFGGDYRRSYATFQLKSGEIVNLGSLTVMSDAHGSAHLSVTDLPAAAVERFRREKPNLASQMQTRLMIVIKPQMSPEERRKMCQSLAELRAHVPSLANHIPPECRSTGTVAPKPAEPNE